MPAWVEPVTLHTTIVSKKTPSSASCCCDLVGPVGEAEAAQTMIGRAGRDRVGHAALGADVLERLLPARLHADAESGLDQVDLARP